MRTDQATPAGPGPKSAISGTMEPRMLKAVHGSLPAFFVIWAITFVVGEILLAAGYGLAGFYLQYGLTDYSNGAWPPAGLPFSAADDIKRSYADSAAGFLTGLTLIATLCVAKKLQKRQYISIPPIRPNAVNIADYEESVTYLFLIIAALCFVILAGIITTLVLIVGLFFMFDIDRKAIFSSDDGAAEQPTEIRDTDDQEKKTVAEEKTEDEWAIWKRIFLVILAILIVMLSIFLTMISIVSMENFLHDSAPQVLFEFFADDSEHVKNYLSDRSSNWTPIFALSLLGMVYRWLAKKGMSSWFSGHSGTPPA